jgi:streptogramin lyase
MLKNFKTRKSDIIILVSLAFLLVSAQIMSFEFQASAQNGTNTLVFSSQVGIDPIAEFSIPNSSQQMAGPLAIVAGRNNTFWFTEFSSGKIGEFFLDNKSIQQFTVPEGGARPAALALDSLGRIWFSDQGGQGSIWMLNPTNGQFTQYKTLSKNSTPLFVLIDSQNNIWFAESTANKLGVLRFPSYNMTEYDLPTSNSEPVELAFGQNDSIIWITETNSGKIAKFNDLTHTFAEFTPPPSESLKSPVGIVYDQSGNVWVSDHGGSAVEELIPSNSTFKRFPTSVPPASVGYPISAVATLSIDSKGRLWFVEHFANKVGRFDPNTNTLDEFAIPTPGAYSVQNALDPNGNFWFTEFDADYIGMVPSNATSPIDISYNSNEQSAVEAGNSVVKYLTITNTLSAPVSVVLNTTSTFSQTGQTTLQECSLNATSLYLGAGESEVVKANITPDSSLSTGLYSVGIVATYQNVSQIAISLISVNGSSSILVILASNIQIELVVIVIVLVLVYFIVRNRKNH